MSPRDKGFYGYIVFNDDQAYFCGSKEECVAFTKGYNEHASAHGEEVEFDIQKADTVRII